MGGGSRIGDPIPPLAGAGVERGSGRDTGISGGKVAARWRGLALFCAGAAAGIAIGAVLTWLLVRPPALPRQYEVTGVVSAVSGDGRGFVLEGPDGGFLGGFALDYETPGRQLIRRGASVTITVLAGDGIQEIVARVEPAVPGSG